MSYFLECCGEELQRWLKPNALCAFIAFIIAAVLCPPVSAQEAAEMPHQEALLRAENCKNESYPADFVCGQIEVFENRTTNSGRKIPIYFVVAPARAPKHERKAPIFYLAGGPGDSAVFSASGLTRVFEPLRQLHDLVFVDLRGTGESAPLFCERVGPKKSLQKHMSYLLRPEDVDACLQQLQQIADLTQYTTTYAAADYEDVRKALAYKKIALFGGSYGTRLAQEIIRRYPDSVELAILFGTAPPSLHFPSGFARSFQDALDAFFELCLTDVECSRAYPDLQSDFAKVIKNARQHGVSAEVNHPEYQDRQKVSLSYGEFVMGLRFLAYNAGALRKLPGQISAAVGGDYSSLVQTIANLYYDIHSFFFYGLMNSMVCAEDLPFVDLAKEKEDSKGTILGTYRMRQQLATCALWPRAQIPEDFHEPVSSSVPVLLVSGALDPVTPPAYGDEIQRTLSRSLHAVLANRGHSPNDTAAWDCLLTIFHNFVDTSQLDGLDISCAAKLPLLPETNFDIVE